MSIAFCLLNIGAYEEADREIVQCMYSFEAAVWLCKLFLEKEDAVLCLCNRVY